MTAYHKIIFFALFITVISDRVFCQTADITISQPLTGNQIIEATNSITFQAGFSFDANSTNLLVAKIIPTTGNSNYTFTEPQESGSLPINTSYPVGSINGTSSVGPTGAAIYSIPIDIPPGRNGMKPNLSLIYNSQRGDGLLGLGWALSGLSAITRVPSDFYHDGFIDVVDFDSNDKFALDGQRLISIGGDQYRTENESFSKITLYGSSTNPTYFKVETKEGLELYFGNTSDSRVEAQGTSNVYSWNLNQVRDKNGNFYNINYTETTSTGEIYPANINYSCFGSTAGDYTIEFGYETRTVPIKTYISGSQVLINKLLDLITIKYGTTVVGKLQLVYVNLMLDEIIKFGKNNTRLNSTYVGWGNTYTGLDESNETLTYTISVRQTYFDGDFNGDGKTDLVIVNNSTKICSLYLADQTGQLQFQSNLTLPSSFVPYKVYMGDFNGDGLKDLLIFRLVNSVYYPSILLPTGNSFTEYDSSVSLGNSSSAYYAGDFNGNGKTDLLANNTSGYNCLITEFNFPGGGGISFSYLSQCNISWGIIAYSEIKEVPFDMNGDGKTELMVSDNSGSRFYGLQDGSNIMTQIGTLTNPDANKTVLFGDFNGDGMTDIFSFDQSNNWKQSISKANGFVQQDITTFNGFLQGASYNNFFAYDMNGDHKSDIVVIGQGLSTSNPVDIYVGYSDGQNFNLQTYTPEATLQIPFQYSHFGDYNGDGVTDYLYKDSSIAELINTYRGRSQYFVSWIENGLGYSTFLRYRSITDGTLYSKGTSTSYPVVSYQAPMYVVSSIYNNNPDFTSFSTSYSYYGAHIHSQGRGFLGFEKLTSKDSASGFKSVDEYEYNSTFFNVSLKKNSLYSVSPDSTSEVQISQTTFTNAVNDLGGQRYFSYVSNSSKTNYLTGITVTKQYTYDSNGNMTTYREDFDDGSYNVNTNSDFSSSGTWLPAKPQSVSITKKHYQDTQSYSISSSFTYYSTGEIHTKTVGPLTTTYTYDSFGNLTYETISDGSNSRTNHYTYDSQNMFIWKSYNALDHVTERTYDYETGNVLSEKTPDNVITNFSYDDFGTLTNKSTSALGQSQSVTIGWTTGNRPLGSVYYKLVNTSGAPTTKYYYDAFGRELRTGTTGFDGNLVYTCTVYNNKGQVSEVSLPHILGYSSLKNVYIYDRYGQKIREESTSGTVTYDYSGKTVQVTKSGGRTYSKTSDSQGNIVSATDNAGSTDYSYKSIGKPGTITSSGSSWTMVYDTYGRQTSLTDPNAGTSNYSYNNFGELTSQTDARNLTKSLTYDNLGRVNTQVSPEGTKTFTYDPSGNPGLLSSVTFPGGSETYNYDANSRLTSKVENIDGTNYTTAYGYDSYSRIETITYPSNFAIKNVYNTFGYQAEVRRNDNNSLIWQGQDVNEFGQFTQCTYGNNLTTTKTYNCLGMLSNKSTGSVQNMDYSFDIETGNLLSQHDNLRSLTEIFSYDDLNRLTYVSGPAPLTMTYSSNGNILSKTSVGDYSYNGSKPHAVTSVTNTDGLIPTATQRVTVTSFNKVDSIIQGNLVYTLRYGHEDQRTISRLYDNGVLQKTVYYAGGYEKEVKPGNNIRQIHYITGGDGLAAIFVKNNGLDTLYYIHTDRLGSINVITNQSGAVVKNYSFDAWGRRRNPADWTYNNIPSTFLFSRGFTGHEHLDLFGLINMNGRVYDPILGRFLSPDNFVQEPDNTQNFNRYSYCLNNPLIYTDPTGFVWDDIPEGHLENIINHRNLTCDGSGGYYNGIGGYGGGYGYADGGSSGSYSYNWNTGDYQNAKGQTVSFYEVNAKFIAPNVDPTWSFEIFRLVEGNPFLIVGTKYNSADNLGRFLINIQIIGKEFTDYNWVQTYSYWDTKKGWSEFKIDPSDVNHGFFYSKLQYETEKIYYQAPASDGFFNDTPNAWQFRAQLTLCGYRNGQWTEIQSFHWGYSYVGERSKYFEKMYDPLPIHQAWLKTAIDFWSIH
jgi:RHS repeat-associated protein